MKFRGSAGFSLVEVTLALGLISFSAVILMALLPVGVAGNQQSIQQTAAANMAVAITLDLKNTDAGSTSPIFGLIKPPASSSSAVSHTFFLDNLGMRTGALDTAANSDARFRVDIHFIPTIGAQGALILRAFFTWPVVPGAVLGSDPVKFNGSYEVFTALDRN